MSTTPAKMSSPVQQLPNSLLYDAVKEALKNKTLHEAMNELNLARFRLCLGVKNLEAVWVPHETPVFTPVGGEEGSSGSATLVEEEYDTVQEREESEDPGRVRSSSWSSIDEWLGQVHYAAADGFEPIHCYFLRHRR